MSGGLRKEKDKSIESRPDIAYYCYVGGFGLSEAGRTNAIALQWAGYRVHRGGASEFGIYDSAEAEVPLVIHHWHPNSRLGTFHHFFENKRCRKRVAYWAWECEAGWFKGMVEHAHHFDEIWTPSDYCSDIFRPLGVPVRTIPHGVRRPFGEPRKRGAMFRVFCPFDAWSRFSRKNPDGAIAAFKQAFPVRRFPNCELVLKTHHLSGEQREELKALAGDSRVILCEGFLSELEIQGMFLESDCVLSLHRSEGFGLNAARAIVSGVPLVATDYGGCSEWMDHCHSVRWAPSTIGSQDYYPEGAFWAEPDIEHAASLLRHVYDEPEACRAKAFLARDHCDFSVDRLAHRMIVAIQELGALPERRGIATAERHFHQGQPLTAQ